MYLIIGLVCAMSFNYGNIVTITIINFYFLLSHVIDLMIDLFESSGN